MLEDFESLREIVAEHVKSVADALRVVQKSRHIVIIIKTIVAIFVFKITNQEVSVR